MCKKCSQKPKTPQTQCTISGPLEFVNDLMSTAREPPRVDKRNKLVLDAIADEKDKIQPALDCPKDPEPEYSPEYTIHNAIKICDIVDVPIFDVLAEMFVDNKTNELLDALRTFNVPELVLPTFTQSRLDAILCKITSLFDNDEDFDFHNAGDELVVLDPWEDTDVVSVVDLDSIELPSDDDLKGDAGNCASVIISVFNSTVKVLSPIVDIINPINYLKLAVKSSQIRDMGLYAERGCQFSPDDFRTTELRENQPLTPDTVVQYKMYVSWSHKGVVEVLPPAYFPEVCSSVRQSHFNRLFYNLPEPDYATLSLSYNMLSELYGPKTTYVSEQRDAVATFNRLFKTNPHNTFGGEAIVGNRVLEDNFMLALRFCRNEYRPKTTVEPVK